MLHRQLAAPDRGDDVQQLVATVDGTLDIAAFRAAWDDLAQSHPILRTRVQWQGLATPVQQAGVAPTPEFTEIDCRSEDADAQRQRLDVFLTRDRARGFRLDVDAPCRVTVFRMAAECTVWVWTFPHLLLDGASFAPLLTDLHLAYEARCAGQVAALAARPLFSDFVTWLHPELARRRDDTRAFFAELLRGFSGRNRLPVPSQTSTPPTPADRNCHDIVHALSPETTAGLHALAGTCNVTVSAIVKAAWALVVSDYSGGDDDVVFGVVRRGRAGTVPGADRMLGMSINTLPARLTIDHAQPLCDWLRAIRAQQVALRPFEQASLVEVQAASEVPAGEALFDSIVVFNDRTFDAQMADVWRSTRFEWIEQTGFPVTLFAFDGPALAFRLSTDPRRFDTTLAHGVLQRLGAALEAFARDASVPVGELERIPASERACIAAWNATDVPVPHLLMQELFETQVRATPDAIALIHRATTITYAALDARANAAAAALQEHGVGPDVLVGICLERGIDMVVALLATLKAGGAYVPIDPGYPAARIAMMLEDCAPRVILTQRSLVDALPTHGAAVLAMDDPDLSDRTQRDRVPCAATPEHLAYLIFTSGSTGRPKAVMVEHRNVANFFTGMDQTLGTAPGVWLAVTSISFDISVLELFWTLGRGYRVVIHDDASGSAVQRRLSAGNARPMEFSLFYFAANAGASGASQFRLLLDGARFADTHGFTAVWTPERHFHEFGGLYPNPAVTSAALATITSNVQLRAGSIVLPLHDPIRIAEEWALIDNLSNGRVGLSFASGWHANDFALAPAHYQERRAVMYEGIETVRRLWRGDAVTRTNGSGDTIEIRTLPRPVQPDAQVWISAAGSTDTFEQSGRIGANMLTNMLGQSQADLERRIAAYRAARCAEGHEGPGHVTLMLHTFIGHDVDEVKQLVREPFIRYLRTSTDLVKQARWEFPAFARPGQQLNSADTPDLGELSAEDETALMSAAFERYFHTHGLFGTPESCAARIAELKAIGVDEVACLIDFGVDDDRVLESLKALNRLRLISAEATSGVADDSISEQIEQHGVTHLQCTPTLAQSALLDPASHPAFARLQELLLGGEAVPEALVARVHQLAPQCTVRNMYGPTETTVWSTTAVLRPGEPVTIGAPIANTSIHLLDRHDAPVPPGVTGELCIGGRGVVRGYHGRDDQTAERFFTRVASDGAHEERLYRTGDLARWNPDGSLVFAGRLDAQVKVRGYRIEPGEIENALMRHSAVSHAAVVVEGVGASAQRLVAYVSPHATDAAVTSAGSWRDIWSAAYAADDVAMRDAAFNVAGWVSSVTGQPLSDTEMREWVDHTVERIRALQPTRILSIGCGTGLLLFELAPHVERYTGVDYAAPALENIRRGLEERRLGNVELIESPAHDLRVVQDASYDVVVLNSVIQYFPTEAYLQQVLQQALRKLVPGGALFIGDVRSLPLLDAFHTAVAVARTAPTASLDALAQAVEQRREREKELVIDAQFFEDFARASDNVDGISIELKHTAMPNEMTAFRYDVVLRKASPARHGLRPTPLGLPAIDGRAFSTLAEVRDAVADSHDGCRVFGLRNGRVAREVKLAALLRDRDGVPAQTVADAQSLLAAESGLDPAAIYAIDPRYDVKLKPTADAPERFDVVFTPRADGWAQRPVARDVGAAASRPVIREPAAPVLPATELSGALRAHLTALLPAWMIPDRIEVLDTLPRTPNGKLDRAALVTRRNAPGQPAEAPCIAPPDNALESQIAAIWRELLGAEAIGRHENLFDLGANSVLVMQANARLRSTLGLPVTVVQMFAHPTIATLAQALAPHTPAMPSPSAASAGQERAQARLEMMQQRRDVRRSPAS